MRYDEPESGNADVKTALLAGTGLGLSALGILAVPILAPAGLAVSFLGWRSARPSYRAGRSFAMLGMVLGLLGLAALVARIVVAG